MTLLHSPSGSCSSWFLSTDSSCKAGPHDIHLLQGLKPRACLPLTNGFPRCLSTQRDKRFTVLLPSQIFFSSRYGRWNVTESRRLWVKSTSEIKSWKYWGTAERLEEEQFNTVAPGQIQDSRQDGEGEEQRIPEEMRSSKAANASLTGDVIVPGLRNKHRWLFQKVFEIVTHEIG